MTVFKFQLRFEDVIGVNINFIYKNKTQIFKTNVPQSSEKYIKMYQK